MIKITEIPDFTQEDEDTLAKLHGSEVFLIVLKLIKKQYFVACSQMEDCTPAELVSFQGTARGFKTIFTIMLNHSSPKQILDSSKKSEGALIFGKKLSNFKG